MAKITTFNFTLEVAPKCCRVLVANGTKDFSQICPITVQEVYSDCVIFTSDKLKSNAHIEKISLPECVELGATSNILQSLKAMQTWEFGKLTKITGGSSLASGCPFRSVNTVLIPNTVKTITNVICGENTTVKMECNNAVSISSNWCAGSSAPTNFTMAKDWDCTVNISIAAGNWSKDQFKDLFYNYLKPVDPNGGTAAARQIQIPAEMFDKLDAEGVIEDVMSKTGWMII